MGQNEKCNLEHNKEAFAGFVCIKYSAISLNLYKKVFNTHSFTHANINIKAYHISSYTIHTKHAYHHVRNFEHSLYISRHCHFEIFQEIFETIKSTAIVYFKVKIIWTILFF